MEGSIMSIGKIWVMISEEDNMSWHAGLWMVAADGTDVMPFSKDF